MLIGGGGHCKSCIDVLECNGTFQIAGIVDIAEKAGSQLLGYNYIGTDRELTDLILKFKNCLITIGQIDL